MGRLHVTSGAVTGVVDRLEKSGLARRVADPADRRRVIVTVDANGLDSRPNVYLGIGGDFERLYRGYSLDELRFLVQHFERAIQITREQAQQLAVD
jgi:DNA-binding MarR family transcriptional regulator